MRINLNNIVPDPNPDDENAAAAPTPWEVYSTGHRNSWRITVQNGQVWESEVSGATVGRGLVASPSEP